MRSHLSLALVVAAVVVAPLSSSTPSLVSSTSPQMLPRVLVPQDADTAPAAAAQPLASGPFNLRISHPFNPALNGILLFACHAGAAIEALCLGDLEHGAAIASSPAGQFYHNISDPSTKSGVLYWKFTFTGPDNNPQMADSPLIVQNWSPDSNVQSAMFYPPPLNPQNTVAIVGFSPSPPPSSEPSTSPLPPPSSASPRANGSDANAKSTMFLLGPPYNDALFRPSEYPPPLTTSTGDGISGPVELRHWHMCWMLVGSGYYYHSLAWVTAGQARNPTCEPVSVVREDYDVSA